jgi:hypothetical protein
MSTGTDKSYYRVADNHRSPESFGEFVNCVLNVVGAQASDLSRRMPIVLGIRGGRLYERNGCRLAATGPRGRRLLGPYQGSCRAEIGPEADRIHHDAGDALRATTAVKLHFSGEILSRAEDCD